MTSKPASERLEKLLQALEERILKASDREILADPASPEIAIRDVKALVQGHLRQIPRGPVLPLDANARLALLQSLLSASANVPSGLRMALSDGRSPSEREVEDLLRELIQLGVLDEGKS
jgi:hypothetical protein